MSYVSTTIILLTVLTTFAILVRIGFLLRRGYHAPVVVQPDGLDNTKLSGNLTYSPQFTTYLHRHPPQVITSTPFINPASGTVYFSVPAYCGMVASLAPQIKSVLNIVENPLEFHDTSFQDYLAALLSHQVSITYVLRPEFSQGRFYTLLKDILRKRGISSKYDFDQLFREITVDNDMVFTNSLGFIIFRDWPEVVCFSSIRRETAESIETTQIFSVPSKEAELNLSACVTHIVSEILESGDPGQAGSHLHWLRDVGILTEHEHKQATGNLLARGHQLKIVASSQDFPDALEESA